MLRITRQLVSILIVLSVQSAWAQVIERISASSASTDGRFIAFRSKVANLVSGDTNNKDDIFVHALPSIAKREIQNRINTEARDSSGEIVAKTSLGISTID